MSRVSTVLLLHCLALIAFAQRPQKAEKIRKPPVEMTSDDRDMENKLCDPSITDQMRDAVYDCMTQHFPEKVQTGVSQCMVEAVPESSDRLYVAKKLCDDKKAKRTLRNCMRAKSFFMIKDLDAEQLDSMTNKYRVCVRNAIDPDATTTVAMDATPEMVDATESQR